MSIQCLLKALSARDQVLVASRRAHQRLDKDCKKAVAMTFRKFLVRERESAIARETVLAKLESAVNNIDVDGDLDDFITQHRQGDEGSLHCCSQALAVLEDLLPLEEQLLSDSHSHSQPASNTKPLTSRDRKEIHTSKVPCIAVDRVKEQEALFKGNPSSKSPGRSRLETTLGETQPTPLHLHLIETGTSRTVGESPAELKRRIDGIEVDEQSSEYLELTKDQIIQHLSRIFYCQLSPKSVENILSSSSSPRHRTFFRDGTSSGYENVSSHFRSSCNDTDNSSPTRSNLMEVSTSNPIAHSSSSSSSSCSNRISRLEELRHPLSVSHNNYISLEENATLERDRYDSILMKSSLTDDSNPVNNQSIENDQSKKYQGNFSLDNILGTNIADDFYSSKGSISGQSHITGLNSPGFCIKSGFSDDDSVDNLGLSAQFLSNVVKTQEGRNAFIVELNQFRSKKASIC